MQVTVCESAAHLLGVLIKVTSLCRHSVNFKKKKTTQHQTMLSERGVSSNP